MQFFTFDWIDQLITQFNFIFYDINSIFDPMHWFYLIEYIFNSTIGDMVSGIFDETTETDTILFSVGLTAIQLYLGLIILCGIAFEVFIGYFNFSNFSSIMNSIF